MHRKNSTLESRIFLLLSSLFPTKCSDNNFGQLPPFHPPRGRTRGAVIRADFWEGDATKHFLVKKGVFSEKGVGNSVNEGFGKDFYRKGNSVKRFGPFTEPLDSENSKVPVLIPFPKISSLSNGRQIFVATTPPGGYAWVKNLKKSPVLQ